MAVGCGCGTGDRDVQSKRMSHIYANINNEILHWNDSFLILSNCVGIINRRILEFEGKAKIEMKKMLSKNKAELFQSDQPNL